MLRIGATWRLVSETRDEAFHIACGLEWLATGQYTFETEHPPLARVVVALGPYLGGAAFHRQPDAAREGRLILEEAPDGERWLVSARAGNLAFFLLACCAVWLLARMCGGPAVAAVSVALFTLVPVLLGHAGVATTDMALAACVAFAYWAWQVWLDSPYDPKRAALVGFASALAATSKFSAFLFLPAALLPLVILRWRDANWRQLVRTRLARSLASMAAVCFVVCWAIYRFAVIPLRTPPGRQFLLLDHWIGATGWVHAAAYRLLEIPLPLTAILKGVGEVFQHNWDGHPAYLLGHVSQYGWWYFFPIVLAVKTPLAMLALTVVGAVAAIRERNARAMEYLLAAVALVLVCLPANIDIGVRYVLAVYLLLAPVAGLGVVWLWQRTRAATILLCLWMIAGSVAAHPDYLADFNLLAMGKPERIVTDSDLDWGQDLRRATAMLRRQGAAEAWIVYTGTARPSCEKGIVYRELPANTRVGGWVAASVSKLYFEGAKARLAGTPEPYGWLKALKPTMKAGRTIWIYHLPGEPPQPARN